jgi:hypothetical protein
MAIDLSELKTYIDQRFTDESRRHEDNRNSDKELNLSRLAVAEKAVGLASTSAMKAIETAA